MRRTFQGAKDNINIGGITQGEKGNIHIGHIVSPDNRCAKPLIECTNKELVIDLDKRQRLLAQEKKAKRKKLFFFVLCGIGAALILEIYKKLGGTNDWLYNFILMFQFILVVVPTWVTINAANTKNEFERRQLAAIKEIKFILKERGF